MVVNYDYYVNYFNSVSISPSFSANFIYKTNTGAHSCQGHKYTYIGVSVRMRISWELKEISTANFQTLFQVCLMVKRTSIQASTVG